MMREIHLSDECWRVLVRLDAGQHFRARRVFPQAHHFRLGKPSGGEYAADVSPSTVDTLLRHGLIAASPVGRFADQIDYAITERGRTVRAQGEFVFDDQNVEAFGGAA